MKQETLIYDVVNSLSLIIIPSVILHKKGDNIVFNGYNYEVVNSYTEYTSYGITHNVDVVDIVE